MLRQKSAALTGIVLLGLAWLGARAADGPATQPGTALATAPATQPSEKTYTVKKGTLTFEINADGVLQTVDAFEVKPKFKAFQGGLTVISAAVHGTRVKKGDVLLDCETTQFKWAMEEAENALAGARAGLKKVQADAEIAAKAEALNTRIQEDAMKNAEAALRWWESVDGPQMLQMADLGIKQYVDSIGDQEDELDQLRKMYKTEDLTKATADIVIKRAVRQVERSKLYMQMAEARREKTKTWEYINARQRVMDAVEQARNALATYKNGLEQAGILRKNSLASARIALEQAEKKVAELKEDANQFTIKAPSDGILMYSQLPDSDGTEPRALKAGDKVAAGNAVMKLYVPGKLRVDVNLNDAQAFWVEAGMKAKVTAAAFPLSSMEGVCTAPVAGMKGMPPQFGFLTTVVVSKVDPRMLPGMKAQVKLDAGKLDDVIVAPISAIADGKVSVRKDGKIEKRDVVIGKSDGKQVEIRSGLTVGEEILQQAKK